MDSDREQEPASKRIKRDASVSGADFKKASASGADFEELYPERKSARLDLEKRVRSAMSKEELGDVDSLMLHARAGKFLFRLTLDKYVDRSYPEIRSRFYRMNGWSYGFYRQDGTVPSDLMDTYRILPDPRRSTMPDHPGKCIHHAIVTCIEARLRLKLAKSGGPRIPNLSIQQVINAVPSNKMLDVFNWIYHFKLVAERRCPFTPGKVSTYNDDLQKGTRYKIDGFDIIHLDQSKVGYFLVCQEVNNDGPVVATFVARGLAHRKSCIRDGGETVMIEVGGVETPYRHCVAVTGFVRHKDTNFFVVMNNLGKEWGNGGMGLLECKLVETIGIPHV